jgi:hypothetical protein
MALSASTPDLGYRPIAGIAEKAQSLLLCCHELNGDKDQVLHLADVLLSRFKLWTSNIGVFAANNSCLDFRLRLVPTARAAFEGDLELLCTHLLSGECAFVPSVLKTTLA